MDRALFPDGVELDSTTMQVDPTSAEFNIQRRTIDMARSGRAFGLDISIGSPTTRFVISAGWGYTPRGDYVESVGVDNFALADYTTDVENLVVLAYREVDDVREAHEDGGSTRNTVATHSSELKVITRTQYNALPASNDDAADLATDLGLDNAATLAVDVQNRLLILAVVKGKGFSGGVPNGYTGTQKNAEDAATGDFASSVINQQAPLLRILAADLPPNPSIKGINIKSVSADTLLGAGQLWLSGSRATPRLSWSSPDANGVSSPPSLAAGTVFSALPTPQTVTIFSETAGEIAKTITVEVLTDLFPSSGYPFHDEIDVHAFYEDPGAVFSTRDELHRSKLGSYSPTQADPHGTGYPDLAQHVAVIPVPVVLGTNTLADNASAILARITTPRSEVSGVFRTLLWAITAGDYSIRFYKNNSDQLEIVSNAEWDGSSWVKDDATATVYSTKFLLHAFGVVELVYTGSPSTFSNSSFKETQSSTSFSVFPTQGLLTLGAGFLTGTNVARPRIETDFADLVRTLLWTSPPLTPGTQGSVRLYALGSATGAILEIVLNAVWDPTGLTWSQDIAGQRSSRVSFLSTGLMMWGKVAGSAAWIDTAWEEKFSSAGSTGNASVAGTVFAGTKSLTLNDTPRFFNDVTIAGDATGRHLISDVNLGGNIHWRRYVAQFSNAYAGDKGFFLEETVNARWDSAGSGWNFDDASKDAILTRDGSTGYKSLRRTAASATPWNDTDIAWAAAGKIETVLAPNGLTSQLYDGVLKFTSPGAMSNPAAGSVGYANTIAALNTPKAWGAVKTASGSLVAGTDWDGYNVATLSAGGVLSAGLSVVFNVPMSSDIYAVHLTRELHGLANSHDVAGGTTTIDGTNPGSAHKDAMITTTPYLTTKVWHEDQSASGFTIYMATGGNQGQGSTNEAYLFNIANTIGFKIGFTVFGRQLT